MKFDLQLSTVELDVKQETYFSDVRCYVVHFVCEERHLTGFGGESKESNIIRTGLKIDFIVKQNLRS